MQGFFYVERRHQLINHVIKTVTVTSLFRCAQACLKEPSCLSVNLIKADKKTTSLPWECELNSSNKGDSPDADYVLAPGIKYADF